MKKPKFIMIAFLIAELSCVDVFSTKDSVSREQSVIAMNKSQAERGNKIKYHVEGANNEILVCEFRPGLLDDEKVNRILDLPDFIEMGREDGFKEITFVDNANWRIWRTKLVGQKYIIYSRQ